jgi:hypothetical protein
MDTQEKEMIAYMLSEGYKQNLIEQWGEAEGREHFEKLQERPVLAFRAARTALAMQMEQAAFYKYETSNSWMWREEVFVEDAKGHKTRQVKGVTPPPYGNCYFYEFLSAIVHGMPSDICFYLDSIFKGDRCDIVYINGLLDDMDIQGYYDISKLLIWHTGDGCVSCYDITPGAIIGGLEYGRSFRGGPDISKRADIVRRWLSDKEQIENVNQSKPRKTEVAIKPAHLSQRQVALHHAYEMLEISRSNSIASTYNWSSESLYGKYLKVNSPSGRRGVPDKKKMLADIRAIFPSLTQEAQMKANKDIEELQKSIATDSDQ